MTQRLTPSDLDSLARDLSNKHWGLTEPAERVDIGVNKTTWRVGDAWLSSAPPSMRESIDRLRAVCAAVAQETGGAYAVPAFLRTRSGEHSVETAGWIWWMTEHVPGRAPVASSPADMEAVAAGMARLHRLLRTLPPTLTVSDTDMVTLFERGTALAADPRLGYGAEQRDIVATAEARVRERLEILTRQPTQLVHGDPSNPNLRMAADGEPVLTGLLDWDHARRDLVLADLATIAQTIVLRSGAPEPTVLLERMLGAYQTEGGISCSVEDVLTGLLMAKFESVAHHGGRYLRGECSLEIVASQPGKIREILRLVDDPKTSGG
ncbi:phosphotransferase enzyme family protein [Planomonospora parontospora]|uniref:phosphotransferase enzyme family protein n=1 Tax=Planomonospora parontospora TaxID=58119 RepID=UPI0016708D65|nr:phosphotransferase [Planomonospora parontospora]GGL42411.1 hypothetical protein GCM10014719_49660 [Planomonospora parontospora subsp. antibiotica]GII18395.1 hypothetical protein Ppa05_51210 [Planomonospora parontospora subsp. antibiotica]